MSASEPRALENSKTLEQESREDVFVFPASFAQQRLWFLNQLEPGSPAYNVSAAIELNGSLNLEALEQCLGELIRRHETLRTTFALMEGGPKQVVSAVIGFSISYIDLRGLSAPERERSILLAAKQEARLQYDLSEGPLFHAGLLCVEPGRHILLVGMHHIISDGWSIAVLVKEMGAHYDAFSSGIATKLNDLAIQYADYTLWQQQWLGGANLERQLAYWRRQLENGPGMLSLPASRPRPAVQTYNGSFRTFEAGADLTRALTYFSHREGASLFMTLLSAFAGLASRYTRQIDIVIGTPIANRNRSEIEPLIGFFVNTLALRIDLSRSPSFSELLERVRRVTLDAYSNQDLPFEMLVEELKIERNLDRNPLFQVLFVLQNAPAPPLTLPGLKLTRIEQQFDTVRFDLEVHLWPEPEGLRGYFVYNTDLFDGSPIERMTVHFLNFLSAAAASPHLPISRLALLSEAERRQLVLWNDTGRGYGPVCVHELVERQTRLTPDRIAIVLDDERVTYAELNDKSNSLARYLQSQGVGPEAKVSIFVSRSAEMVIALLGVLKAGAAYVPLDTRYPAKRIAYVLADTGAAMLVTERGLLHYLPDSRVPKVCLDEETLRTGEQPAALAGSASPDHLAYVLYTSGSTGTPKGVGIEHHSAAALLLWAKDVFTGNEPAGILASTSICFDLSIFEIFLPLISGGKAILAENALHLPSLNAASEVTLINTVPSAMAELVRSNALPASTSIVNLAGEPLKKSLVEEVYGKTQATQVWNLYGPTEHATYTTGDMVPQENSGAVAIGRPIANTRVYILDEEMCPAPIGVTGELYTAGEGVARGYLGRADLTADRFVPEPFQSGDGKRMYKTGDLARYLDDGRIEYLGRIDRQVKVRGFRIEPGEIERHLVEHAEVRDAAVIVSENEVRDKRITAYLVAEPATRLSDRESEDLASQHLSQWEQIFDGYVAGGQSQASDPLMNTTGWISSYNGLPIPEEEMKSWVDDIVSQVLDFAPQRVMELGCGTGMLLFKIAPHCRAYHGTDLSEESLSYLRSQIAAREGIYSNVTLARRGAHDFDGIEDGSCDAIILSSVVQYFPSVDYLLSVIKRSAKVLRPGGMILLADVRNNRLLEAFHASVQLQQAGPSASLPELRRRAKSRILQETELCLDPEFFRALEGLPEIASVKVTLERGTRHNELNRFRYHVLIYAGPKEPAASVGKSIAAAGMAFEEIALLLEQERPATAYVAGMVNSRISEAVQAATLLFRDEIPETVEELLKAARATEHEIDPEQIWRLGESLGYRVDVTWSTEGADRFDAIFVRRGATGPGSIAWPTKRPLAAVRPWGDYANNPLEAKRSSSLIPRLKSYLKERLPDYMVPDALVRLEALPLTTNGKVDHQALMTTAASAAPKPNRTVVKADSRVERTISEIVESVLEIEAPDVEANFFDMGANSIRIVQIHRKVQETLGARIPIVEMFKNPTIRMLGRYIGDTEPKRDDRTLKRSPLDQLKAQADRRKQARQERFARSLK